MRQEPALVPQVAYGCLRAAVAAEQQPAAKQNHRHNGHHFNNGEPELHFTKHFHVGQVNGIDGDKEHRSGHPGWDLGPPELNIFPDGGQLGHGHQNVQYPVVPTGSKAGKTAPVFIRKMTE